MKKDFLVKLEETVLPVHDDVEVKCYPLPVKDGFTSLFAGIECRRCEVVLKPVIKEVMLKNVEGMKYQVFECPECMYEMSDQERTKLCQEYIEAIARLGGINLNIKKKEGFIWGFLRLFGVRKKSQALLQS